MPQHVLSLGTTSQPCSAQASQEQPSSLPPRAHLALPQAFGRREGKERHQSGRRELSPPQLTPGGRCRWARRATKQPARCTKISIGDTGSSEAASLSACSRPRRHAAAMTTPQHRHRAGAPRCRTKGPAEPRLHPKALSASLEPEYSGNSKPTDTAFPACRDRHHPAPRPAQKQEERGRQGKDPLP